MQLRPGSSKHDLWSLKEKLTSEPNPQARMMKSILYLLSRTGSELATTNPDRFVEARFINELEESGFIQALYKECHLTIRAL